MPNVKTTTAKSKALCENIWPTAHVFAYCSFAGICLLILTRVRGREAAFSIWNSLFCFKQNEIHHSQFFSCGHLHGDCVWEKNIIMLKFIVCFIVMEHSTHISLNWKWCRRWDLMGMNTNSGIHTINEWAIGKYESYKKYAKTCTQSPYFIKHWAKNFTFLSLAWFLRIFSITHSNALWTYLFISWVDTRAIFLERSKNIRRQNVKKIVEQNCWRTRTSLFCAEKMPTNILSFTSERWMCIP